MENLLKLRQRVVETKEANANSSDLAEELKSSFYKFFIEFWSLVESEEYEDNFHIKYLCDVLQDMAIRVWNGEEKKHDVVINVPPGQTKSKICSQMFNAWVWSFFPEARIGSLSFERSLALDHAQVTRDIVTSPKYMKLFPNVRLRKDTSGKGRFMNTKGGERFSVGITGNITGRHYHFLLPDDPINPKGATSEASLKEVKRAFTVTLPSRLLARIGVIILIMQRLGEKDPSAIMLAWKKVKHVCLPYNDSFPMSGDDVVEWQGESKTVEQWYEHNEGLLNPSRLPESKIEELEDRMSKNDIAMQYAQQIGSMDGSYISEDDFEIWTIEMLDKYLPEIFQVLMSVIIDTSETDNPDNDPCAMLFSRFFQGKLFLFDYKQAHLQQPQQKKWMELWFKFHNLGPSNDIRIEPKSTGLGHIQTFEDEYNANKNIYNVERQVIFAGKVSPDGVSRTPKEKRILRVQPHLKKRPNKVILVVDETGARASKDWKHFIECLLYFPRASVKEPVDLLGYKLFNNFEMSDWTGDTRGY